MVVFESCSQLYGVIYDANGVFSTAVVGGPAVKGTTLPVCLVLPDDQGTALADYDAFIGPGRRPDVWLAPAGTSSVIVRRGEVEEAVPLP